MNTQEQSAFDKMREALQFYAERDHFMIYDENAWDTVSGEPQNFWEDESNTAMVEDGSIARAALAAAKEVSEPMKVTDLGRYAFEPQAAAVLPDGSVVTNVYEAFEAGKRAVQPQAQGEAP